jgi:tetratricopeptide (TPR) repeat protein
VPVDAIVDKTDGVPLFIEELTKAAMASSSACDPVGGHAERGQPQGPLALPSTLKASLMSRLDRLPGADQVMPIGAALGRSFSYALLAAVTRLDAGTLVPILARLVDAELLLQRGEPPDAIYSFKHALVQDIAYESQLKSRMRELHARIAATIEASFAEIAENRPELVAQHYAHGGLPTRAVPYWERAAEKAVASAANQEAIAHLEAALRDNGQDPDRTARARNEIRLREALCVPLEARSWGSADIANNLARLQELVAEHGDNAQLFTILHGLCGTHLIGGNIEQALNDAGEMLRIADRADDPALNVLSRHALGMSSFFLGAFDQAIEHFEQAIEGRQGVSDDALQKYYVADPQVVGRCMQAWAIALQDKTEATGVRITQGLALVEGAEHDFTKVYGLALLASVSQTRGDAPGAIDLAVRADELSRHGDFTYWQAWAGIVLGWATAMTGSPTSGIQRLEAGLEVYRQTGSQQIVPYGQALLADAYLKGGEIAMAMTAIKEIDAFQRDHSVRFYDRRIDQLRQRLHQDAAIHRQ